MKQLHSRVKRHLTLHKNHYFISLASVGVLAFVASGIFFVTRGAFPHTSELAFTEHSILGKSSGSVIPASCDSNPPYTGHENCFLDAQFVSQGAQYQLGGASIPADPTGQAYYVVHPGETIYSHFRIRNTGNVNWQDLSDYSAAPGGYGRAIRLGSINDSTDPFTGTGRVSLNSSTASYVAPGGETIFIMQGQVPTGVAGQVLRTHWRMVDEARAWFGGEYWMTFRVECPSGYVSIGGSCFGADSLCAPSRAGAAIGLSLDGYSLPLSAANYTDTTDYKKAEFVQNGQVRKIKEYYKRDYPQCYEIVRREVQVTPQQ